MRSFLVAVFAGSVAGAAHAQPFEGYGYARFEVATSQDGPWSRHLSVTPDTRVFVRQVNGWVSPDPVFGWASTTFEEVRFVGADGSDSMTVSEAGYYTPEYRVPNVTGQYTLWKRQGTSATWAIYDTPTGRKLDNAVNPDTTGRTLTGQSIPFFPPFSPQGFDSSNPVVSMHFRFTAGTAPLGPRSIRITAEWHRSATPAPFGNQFVVYINEAGSNTKFTTDAVLEDAVVTIVPGPASAAVLLGLLALGARHRSEHSPTPPRPSPEGLGEGGRST